MSPKLDQLLLYGSMLIPIGFAFVIWLERRQPYQRWARIASLIGCAAGIGWDVITLMQRPLSMQRYPFLLTVSVKQLLIGILISVAIARQQEKQSTATQNSDATDKA